MFARKSAPHQNRLAPPVLCIVQCLKAHAHTHTQMPDVDYSGIILYSQERIITAPANYHLQLES